MAWLQSEANMGYVPFPIKMLPYVAGLVKPATFSGGRMLDGCAGEGRALEFLAKAWNLTPFANEWNYARAAECKTRFGALRAIQGDFFQMKVADSSFNLQWLNPPFQKSNDSPTRRSEAEFLAHAWSFIPPYGGIMVFTSYVHHLTENVMYKFYEEAEDVRTFTLPGLDFGAYQQVVTIAKAKYAGRQTMNDQKMAQDHAAKAAAAYALVLKMRDEKYEPTQEERDVTFFPMIDAVTEPLYEIPELKMRGRKFEFAPHHIDDSLLAEITKDHGPQNDPKFTEVVSSKPPARDIEVVITPRVRQLAGLLAAGLFNGLMLDTPDGRATVRSVVRQVERLVTSETTEKPEGEEDEDYEEVDDEEEGVTKLVYRTTPETTITLLYEDGTVVNISSDQDIAKFIGENKKALLDYVKVHFKPTYEFDFVGGRLEALLNTFRVVSKDGEKFFPLLMTQKHVVSAMFAKLVKSKAVNLAGEMGVGKTIIGASLMEALRYRDSNDAWYEKVYAPYVTNRNQARKTKMMRKDQFNLVICPPHLVDKWEREIRGNSPDAYIGTIRSGEGTKPIVEVVRFLNGLDTQPANVLKVLILSREMMKVGETWSAAAQVRRVIEPATGDEKLMLIEPTTGLQIVEPRKGNAPIKEIPFARLQKRRLYLGIKPDTKEFRRPKRGEKGRIKPYGGNHEMMNRAKERMDDPAYSDYTRQRAKSDYEYAVRMARNLRRKHDAEQMEKMHPALWQEERSFSALPVNPGVVLADRLGIKTPRLDGEGNVLPARVMPLPDLVMKYLDQSEYRHTKSPRGPLAGVASFLAEYYGDRIYMAIFDEFHEYANTGSAQGAAMTMLANVATKVVGMTGTLYKGVASSLYGLEFMTNDRIKVLYPWETGRARWVGDMGVIERIVKIKSGRDGRNTAKTTQTETIKEIPGASPLLLAEIIDHTVFVGIRDIGKVMPDFNEFGVPVAMDDRLASEYRIGAKILKDYLTERKIIAGDSSFMGAYFNALLNWPNYPYDPMEVWHRRTVIDPVTEKEQVIPKLIYTFPGLGHDYVTPKEKALIEEINTELAAGRGVAVYLRQTGKSKTNPKKSLLNRLHTLIKDKCGLAKPVVMESHKVKASDREAWLEKHADANVLICNANLVKTGLDLLRFPTILWYELDYALTTIDQASHRAWRIGQTKSCDVKYLYYSLTAEQPASVGKGRWSESDEGIPTLDITGMSVGDVQDAAINSLGATGLGAVAIADAIGFFMGGGDDEDEYDEDGGGRGGGGGSVVTTMEAKGVALIDAKRAAAAFLYGNEGASLSAMTQGSAASLKDLLAEALDKDDVLMDSSKLFKSSAIKAGEVDAESDWHVEEAPAPAPAPTIEVKPIEVKPTVNPVREAIARKLREREQVRETPKPAAAPAPLVAHLDKIAYVNVEADLIEPEPAPAPVVEEIPAPVVEVAPAPAPAPVTKKVVRKVKTEQPQAVQLRLF